MPKDGSATKEKILDTAMGLVLNNGFTGMSIDRLITDASITKGAFFYHFKSKDDLARALIKKHLDHDNEILEGWMARAEKFSRDPLQQFLIFIGFFVEFGDGLKEPYSGCLLASYCYQQEALGEEVMKTCGVSIINWRRKLGDKIKEIMARYTPIRPVEPDTLADNMFSILEGAFIISKTLNDPKILSQQVAHYRDYIELLFSSGQKNGG